MRPTNVSISKIAGREGGGDTQPTYRTAWLVLGATPVPGVADIVFHTLTITYKNIVFLLASSVQRYPRVFRVLDERSEVKLQAS